MTSVLRRLWTDRMDVYRHYSEKEGKVTKHKTTKIISGVPCHFSMRSLVDVGDGVPALVNSYKLFCGLEVDVREGDEIVVTQRNGRQIKLTVGECMPYSTHQEFAVKRTEKA